VKAIEERIGQKKCCRGGSPCGNPREREGAGKEVIESVHYRKWIRSN